MNNYTQNMIIWVLHGTKCLPLNWTKKEKDFLNCNVQLFLKDKIVVLYWAHRVIMVCNYVMLLHIDILASSPIKLYI